MLLIVFILPFLSADALKTLDQVQFGKWITYLQMKASFYESYVSVHVIIT